MSPTPVPMTPLTLEIARPQAVRLLGISTTTFYRLEGEGVLVATTKGTGKRHSMYDVYTLVPSYLAHRIRQLQGSLEHPRDRKDRSQAELNELRLARERREVLPRDQVVREGAAFIAAVQAKLRALPNALVRRGLLTAEAERPALEIVHEMLGELARWRTELDLLAAEDDAP
jgi:hypothetical protein